MSLAAARRLLNPTRLCFQLDVSAVSAGCVKTDVNVIADVNDMAISGHRGTKRVDVAAIFAWLRHKLGRRSCLPQRLNQLPQWLNQLQFPAALPAAPSGRDAVSKGKEAEGQRCSASCRGRGRGPLVHATTSRRCSGVFEHWRIDLGRLRNPWRRCPEGPDVDSNGAHGPGRRPHPHTYTVAA